MAREVDDSTGADRALPTSGRATRRRGSARFACCECVRGTGRAERMSSLTGHAPRQPTNERHCRITGFLGASWFAHEARNLYDETASVVGRLVEVLRATRMPIRVASFVERRKRRRRGKTEVHHGVCTMHMRHGSFGTLALPRRRQEERKISRSFEPFGGPTTPRRSMHSTIRAARL